MNNQTLAQIITKLGTMDGKYWPAPRDGEGMDADRASYAEVLHDLTDAVGQSVLRSMLTAFPQRPSHKALREWAISLTPQPAFDIRQLDTPSAPRLTTGGNLKPVASGIPESVKSAFARFRAQVPPEETPQRSAARRPVYHTPMPEAERPRRMREAARWLRAEGITAPKPALVAHTAEAKWREAQRERAARIGSQCAETAPPAGR